MIDAHILMTEAKHFKNLHLQESRLNRRYGQDAKELKELQARRKREQEKKEQTQKAAPPKTFTAAHGFEFTTPAEPIRAGDQVTSFQSSKRELIEHGADLQQHASNTR
jgi:hypothetical protein